MDDEQLIAAHPQVADQLREFLATEGQVHRMAGGRVEDTSAVRRAADDTQDRSPKAACDAAAIGPIPRRFGRYVIHKTLGKGGMGVVYLAEDTELHRLVALKIPTLADDDPERSAERLSRFFREARAAATLRHAHICPVFDVGQIDGRHYISMAYIEGSTLQQIIKKQGPQPERAAASLVRKLAIGLAEAHAAGVVHRDLKPSNVMVDRKGEPVITDFGLARQLATSDDSRLTQSGVVMGSPAYMSPEQVDGDDIGPASDIYSLGVILYETLTGRVPFAGPPMQVMKKVAHDEPPRPSELRGGLDPRLETICLRMMAKTPGERYGSMDEIAATLADYLKGLEIPPRPAPRPAVPPPIAQRLPVAAAKPPTPSAVAEPALPSFAPPARPSPLAQRTAAARRQSQTIWLVGGGAAALGLLGLLFAAAVVLLVQTGPKTTVRIEYDDPAAVAWIDGGKIRIENIGQPIQIEPGEHTLTIKRGDIVVKTDHFAIERGERRVLDIALPEAQPLASEPTAEPPPDRVAMGGAGQPETKPTFPAIRNDADSQPDETTTTPRNDDSASIGKVVDEAAIGFVPVDEFRMIRFVDGRQRGFNQLLAAQLSFGALRKQLDDEPDTELRFIIEVGGKRFETTEFKPASRMVAITAGIHRKGASFAQAAAEIERYQAGETDGDQLADDDQQPGPPNGGGGRIGGGGFGGGGRVGGGGGRVGGR